MRLGTACRRPDGREADAYLGREPQAGPAKIVLIVGRFKVRMGLGAASIFLLGLLPGATGLGTA